MDVLASLGGLGSASAAVKAMVRRPIDRLNRRIRIQHALGHCEAYFEAKSRTETKPSQLRIGISEIYAQLQWFGLQSTFGGSKHQYKGHSDAYTFGRIESVERRDRCE